MALNTHCVEKKQFTNESNERHLVEIIFIHFMNIQINFRNNKKGKLDIRYATI